MTKRIGSRTKGIVAGTVVGVVIAFGASSAWSSSDDKPTAPPDYVKVNPKGVLSAEDFSERVPLADSKGNPLRNDHGEQLFLDMRAQQLAQEAFENRLFALEAEGNDGPLDAADANELRQLRSVAAAGAEFAGVSGDQWRGKPTWELDPRNFIVTEGDK